MIAHHLQKTILRNLGGFNEAHFSDIQPQGVDGNIFTYHLQQLIKQGYVLKTGGGLYCLTSSGKDYLIRQSGPERSRQQEVHSVLLLAVKQDDKWLVRKRLIQPNLGLTGFVHGEPNAD